MTEQVRLGGMALGNGVLVHGPRFWACAVRAEDGRLVVASSEKTVRSADVRWLLLRAPARVVELLALIRDVGDAVPNARLPFRERRMVGALAGTAFVVRALRASALGVVAQEAIAALLSVVPVALALRGSTLACYHGAEHIAIGTYEHGVPRPREHERCGSHMLGPLLAVTVAGNSLASSMSFSPRGTALARAGVAVGSIAVAGELFAWMQRHQESALSRALAWPGHELQSRFLTAEPTPDQLDVAEAALRECLRLELQGDGQELDEGEEAHG